MNIPIKQLMWVTLIGLPVIAAVLAALGFKGRDIVIGVDLGTTYSTVAYRSQGSMHVMRNERNETVTASVIAVNGTVFVVGRAAMDAVSDDPMTAVFDSKRVIGRRLNDAVMRSEMGRHGGRLIQHPRTQRDAFGKVVAGAKLKLCRTCEAESAFVLRVPDKETGAALASDRCVDAGSLLSGHELLQHINVLVAKQRTGAVAASQNAGQAEATDVGDDVLPIFEPVDFSLLAPQIRTSEHYLLLTPTAAACLIVRHLLAALRRELGHGQIKAATVTIPAEFDGAQRAVTLDAYARAGVTPGRVLHEPAAAAIAYGLHREGRVHHVLVFDMGGGTLDVSVLYANEGAFTVIGTSGDAHLGGEDFDDCVLGIIAGQLRERDGYALDGFEEADAPAASPEEAFQRRRTGSARRDLARHEHGVCSYAWLKREAERVKIALSSAEEAEWRCTLEGGRGRGQDVAAATQRTARRQVTGGISRAEFEGRCAPLFERSLVPVRRGLERANVDLGEVDEVVLVGGSSRLRHVRALLQTTFDKPLRFTVDPDLAVATGAAMVVD
jgi:molecular chaperone DnaK (HSP70)